MDQATYNTILSNISLQELTYYLNNIQSNLLSEMRLTGYSSIKNYMYDELLNPSEFRDRYKNLMRETKKYIGRTPSQEEEILVSLLREIYSKETKSLKKLYKQGVNGRRFNQEMSKLNEQFNYMFSNYDNLYYTGLLENSNTEEDIRIGKIKNVVYLLYGI